MRLLNLFTGQANPRRNSTRRKTAHGAGLGHRLCRVEPLEQRMLLSVASPAHEPFRVGLWTPELIEDLGAFVESQPWPEVLGDVDPYVVRELVHIPLRTDARGGYRTIVTMHPLGQYRNDEAIAALTELDFVDFARPESECVVRYTSRSQELIDAITTGHSEEQAYLCVEPELVQSVPIEMRVTVWSEAKLADIGAWVDAQSWPEALGAVDGEWVDQLISIPVRSEPRGGYFTIFTMPVSGDVSALEQVEFIEHARLESESVVQYGPRAQEHIDALTTTGSEEGVHTEVIRLSQLPIEMRITFWTEQRIPDVDAFVEAREWPESLGYVDGELVEQLVSIPIRSEPRGGYFTIVSMDILADISALDRVDFVEHARLEAESVVQFSAGAQESFDRRTMTRSKEPVHAALAESGPLISMDDFRDDSRFSGMDGSGYAVAILDSGIDLDHSYFGPDNDSNGVADRIVYHYDFCGNNDPDGSDENGHGTHVSSIAASEHGTNTGMAPAADIVALKVLDQYGSGTFGDIEEALEWVAEHASTYNIATVNMSLSDQLNHTSATQRTELGIYDDLETLVEDEGVIVVSASGNSFHAYDDTQGVAYPSADPNSLSIGAVYDDDLGRRPPTGTYPDGSVAYTTDADRITSYSQRHETLTTVLAPGELITAAWLNGGTATKGGTSMAAPHIAGIAVLAQQLAVQELGQPLTQDQFANLLQETGTTVNDGDDEDDNVTNTDVDFARVDMFALGEGILDLHWEVDAGEDADDDEEDMFVVSRVGDDIKIDINGSSAGQRAVEDVIRITINGSGDIDRVQVNPLGSDFDGNVVINRGEYGAADRAYLRDSSGDDKFYGYATYAKMEIEDAYTVTANGFRYVTAYAYNGGADRAQLYDSAGNDYFTAYPTWGFLSGAGFYNRAEHFDYVHGYGNQGGNDTAELFDSAGDDSFVAYLDYAILSGTGFYNRAKFFDEVYAYANNGGTDGAQLYDSAGDDSFVAYPDYGVLSGSGFYNRAVNFEYLHGYANYKTGDSDAAVLYDSAGDDSLVAYPDYAILSGSGFYNRAKFFAEVEAHADNGGTDIAQLYDSVGDDTYEAYPDYGVLSGTGFYNRAEDFETLHGYANNEIGDSDAAVLYDSAGDDSLVAYPDYAILSGSGFYNRAKFFAEVEAYASDGTDVAQLRDSAGNDSLTQYENQAMVFSGSGFDNRANYFDEVYAYANAGGTDTAYLLDSDGNDTFTFTHASGIAILSGSGFFKRAKFFDEGTAHAEDHDDYDTATLDTGEEWVVTGDWESVGGKSGGAGAKVNGSALELAGWLASLDRANSPSRDNAKDDVRPLNAQLLLVGAWDQ